MPDTHNRAGDLPSRLKTLSARLGFDEHRTAAYLGAPIGTYRKWLVGTRSPNAVVGRLLEVLGLLEALAPAIHDGLLPPAVVRRRPGRPGRPPKS